MGIHGCAKHEFTTNGDDELPDQEEEWYQHLRDEEHTYRINKPCQNCGLKSEHESITAKVPQPTPDVKNPRSVIVFCDNDTCKKEYLEKMGI